MFITFEGIDGSGKSTQAQRLQDALEARGHTVCRVREPGGTLLGESIRDILLDPASSLTPRAELLLFSASRAQLVDMAIEPALARGEVVIADRFYDSTTAYQGAGRQVASVEWLNQFHKFVTGHRVPDRTYLLTISPEDAERRLQVRTGEDRMESAGRAFFERAAKAYQELEVTESGRIVSLDAMQDADWIASRILADAVLQLG